MSKNPNLRVQRITAKWLRQNGACKNQIEIFEREWPKGAEITAANIRRGLALELEVFWAADLFLTAAALEAYDKARAAALEAYQKANAAALEAYHKARAAALEAYKKANAAALIKALGEEKP